MRIPRRAQSISEYSICVAVIILATIAMQSYLRRGLQGRYADLVDQTVQRVSPSSPSPITQYEPYYVDENSTTEAGRSLNVRVRQDGWQRTTFSNRSGELYDETARSGVSIQETNCYDD